MIIMDKIDIAWLAGLIEGEGCIRVHNIRNPRITVEMTDKDIIDRLQSITESGSIAKRKKKQLHHKQAWTWSLCTREDVARVLLAIYPLMGERKKAQISKCADAFLSPRNPGKRKNLRPCGTVAATRRHYSNGEKPCDECRIAVNASKRRIKEPTLL